LPAAGFFDMLRDQGLALTHCVALPDHADAASLLQALLTAHGVTWLCTEKDAVKLFPALQGKAQRPKSGALPLELPEPAFFAALDTAAGRARLSSRHGHQTA
jgi:tetraacyldisaccharide 4'-kinase